MTVANLRAAKAEPLASFLEAHGEACLTAWPCTCLRMLTARHTRPVA